MINEQLHIGCDLSDAFFEACLAEDMRLWVQGLPFREDADWLYSFCGL